MTADRAALERAAWPCDRLGELVGELLRRTRLGDGESTLPPAPATLPAGDAGAWIERAVRLAGAEAEAVAMEYGSLEADLRRAAPAVVLLPSGDGEPQRFLALTGSRRRQLEVLTPEHRIAQVSAEALGDLLRQAPEAPVDAVVEDLLDRAGATASRRRLARRALLERSLGRVPIEGCWLLRPSPGGDFLRQLLRTGAGWRIAALVTAHVLQYALFLASWYLIGRGALSGTVERGELTAWALLLATLIPVSLATIYLHGRLVIDVGILLKRRLLVGALKLPLDRIRSQGSGELLGRVIEAETFEALILSGGFQALTAGLEVLMVVPVFWMGAGGALHAALFAGWLAVTALAARRFHRHLGRWTHSRLSQTLELVERMAGYRTRLAQQSPELWHEGEDDALAAYHERSRPMDRTAAFLNAGVPRGWMLVGTLALLPPFLTGGATLVPLAVAFAANLLAFAALAKLTFGLTSLAAAGVAWRQIEPLFEAAAEAGETGDPAAVLAADRRTSTETDDGTAGDGLLVAENLTYRYPDGPAPVLRGASLELRRGDRALLEGASGAGKSTLITLLTGLRSPDGGLLLLDGLDRPTVGDELWRDRLAAAPQFHENHVFLGTFAYNLLLGRGWPPSSDDLREAEDLCRELGLGDLLERMPGGLQQMVGETGWQLSHGEKSRLYLARALLQGADLVILDESFSALDPESLRRALATTFERSPTLLVVAHP